MQLLCQKKVCFIKSVLCLLVLFTLLPKRLLSQVAPIASCLICEKTKTKCVPNLGEFCPGQTTGACYINKLGGDNACTIFLTVEDCKLLGVVEDKDGVLTTEIKPLDCVKVVNDKLNGFVPPALPDPDTIHEIASLADRCCLFNHEIFHSKDEQMCDDPYDVPCREQRAFKSQLDGCFTNVINSVSSKLDIGKNDDERKLVFDMCQMYLNQNDDKNMSACLCKRGHDYRKRPVGDLFPAVCFACHAECVSGNDSGNVTLQIPQVCKNLLIGRPVNSLPLTGDPLRNYCGNILERRYPQCRLPQPPQIPGSPILIPGDPFSAIIKEQDAPLQEEQTCSCRVSPIASDPVEETTATPAPTPADEETV